jgi:ABC-type Fe3+/spermidine/putrescine transport system ATPase subunit
MAISDRIAVMAEGRLAQLGTAGELYRRPASAFVAGFLGRTNLLRGTASVAGDGALSLDLGGLAHTLRDASARTGRVCAVIRPEAIEIGPPGSGLPAQVTGSTYLGEKIEYAVLLGGQTLHVVRFNPPEAEHFPPGSEVAIRLPERGVQILAEGTP